MTQWTYVLLMNSGTHTEMRVFQVVDNQQIPIVEFSGRRSGELLTMTIVIQAEQPKAGRIEALLSRLQSMVRVDCFPAKDVTSDE